MSIQMCRWRCVLGWVLVWMGVVAMAYFLYWLLPVTPQGALSSESVRFVFSDGFGVTIPYALNAVWIGLLQLVKAVFPPASTEETFAWAAAVHGWIGLAAILIAFLRGTWRESLLALFGTVACLSIGWSLVVPTGFSIGVLALATFWFFADRKKSLVAPFFGGFASAMTPVAWPLAIFELVKARQKTSYLLFVLGLALPGIPAAANSAFSFWPALTSLLTMAREDSLAAASVIGIARGEVALALMASLVFVLLFHANRKVALATIGVSVVLFAPQWRAWRMAHPGWNSIVFDAAGNSLRVTPLKASIETQTTTEWAAIRYVQDVMAKNVQHDVLRPSALPQEMRPNVEPAVVWAPSLVDGINNGEAWILGYGILEKRTGEARRFVPDMESMRKTSVVAHPSIAEYSRGFSFLVRFLSEYPLEYKIVERYAVFHLAKARIYEREKKEGDWEHRAMAERYAALRKVEWNKEAFESVCVQRTTPLQPADELCGELRPFIGH